jgi:propanol-preferring alcohol dehydrogenase
MMEAASTYRAVHAVSPGRLELTEKTFQTPGLGKVRIRAEACGVCHSDSATMEGILPIQWPRVPGHEAVGRIDVIGEGVEGWVVGQRVGVGFLGGSCGHCEFCRDGRDHAARAGRGGLRADDVRRSPLQDGSDDDLSAPSGRVLCPKVER